jgi:NAD(P)-dependent dehydrogenase (short-subunit alcohol dehydrogenase family)
MVMYNPFTLKGKTIFVSGASSGIGRAIAIECSKMGARICITGRNAERLDNTFMQLEGGDHLQIVADLQTDDGIRIVVEGLPSLDGLVHCAGIVKPTPFQFTGKEVINDIMGINFNSPAILSHQLLKNKKINRKASIVFISSISGVLCSSVGGSVYSASKGAINGLVKGMALDLAPKMIRVNTVNPGMIDTNIFAAGPIAQDQLAEDMKRYPLKRYGRPEEVAYLVIYLLSDASSWVTGSSLIIDGGYTLL